MAEKEQENALGGWLVKAATALIPATVSAVCVAWVTLQIVRVEVDKLIKSDSTQNETLIKHTADLAVFNERLVQSIELLKMIAKDQGERIKELEKRIEEHRTSTDRAINGRTR